MFTKKDPTVIAAYFFCCIIAIFAIAAGWHLLALILALIANAVHLFVDQPKEMQQRVWDAEARVRRELNTEIADIYEHYDKALIALERLIAAVEADKNPHGVGLVHAAEKAREMYNELTQ